MTCDTAIQYSDRTHQMAQFWLFNLGLKKAPPVPDLCKRIAPEQFKETVSAKEYRVLLVLRDLGIMLTCKDLAALMDVRVENARNALTKLLTVNAVRRTDETPAKWGLALEAP